MITLFRLWCVLQVAAMIALAIGIILSTGCARKKVMWKSICREDPILEQVMVKGGSIDTNNTKKVIDNHLKSWEYIEYLKIKGCIQ